MSSRTQFLVVALGLACAQTARVQPGADSASHAAVAAERALNGRSSARKVFAVLPFTVTATDSSLAPLGYGLAEFLSDDLAHSHRITMVERVRLADIQREQNLSLTSAVDPVTGIRVGCLIAGQHLIHGTIDAPSRGPVTIDARGVDVSSGDIDMQRRASAPLETVFRAERDLVMHTFSNYGITLTDDEKRALYERVVPNFRAFLVFSRGVRAEQQGQDALAIASFMEAATLDRNFKLAATRLAAARARVATAAAPVTAAGATAATAPRAAPTAASTAAAKVAEAKETSKPVTAEDQASATPTTKPVTGPASTIGGPAPSAALAAPAAITTETTAESKGGSPKPKKATAKSTKRTPAKTLTYRYTV